VLAISTLNLAELYVWAYGSKAPQKLLNRVRDFLQDVEVISVDGECAHQFGMLRPELIRAGIHVSPFDLMIAAVAIVHNRTLVAHNIRDFENIPGRRWVDWLAE
jgi:tRNA(fMet)-specific endonuclease VapC